MILIIGIFGCCRRQELTDLQWSNVTDKGDTYKIFIPTTKNKLPRTFYIPEDFYPTVKKYASLRPPSKTPNRFFLNYKSDKKVCTRQVSKILK